MKRKFFTMLGAAALSLFAMAANAQNVVIFVSPSGNNSNSGNSWAAPKGPTYLTTLGGTSVATNTKIYLRGNATYNYTSANGISITTGGFQIKGGYPNGLTGKDTSGYDPVANPTTISVIGPSSGSGMIAEGSFSDASLVGIHFTSNNASSGARIFNGTLGSSATHTINFVDDEVSGFGVTSGGGYQPFFTQDYGTYNFTHCSFHDNGAASDGAAINIAASSNATLNINNCAFNNNVSGTGQQGGGGAVASLAATNNIINSSFCLNSAPNGAGGAIGNGAGTGVALGSWTISYCTFSQNTCGTYWGGALCLNSGSDGGGVSINYCNFYSNQNTGASYGGGAIGIASNHFSTTMKYCHFYGNSIASASAASASPTGGGAVVLLNCSTLNSVTINNSVFDSNSVPTGSWGGAIEYPSSLGSFGAPLYLDSDTMVNNKLGGSTTINGCDIALFFGYTAIGSYSVTNSRMQLASSSSYVANQQFGGNPWSFTNCTFGNTSGSLATTSSTCSTALVEYYISGTVWDDANGNAIQDGAEAVTNGGGLYANLLSGGSVVQSVAVNASTGAYSFIVNQLGTAYQVVLTNTATATTSTLNTGWVSTGVNLGGTATTSNQTGIISIPAITSSVTLQNFAIEQTPTNTGYTKTSLAVSAFSYTDQPGYLGIPSNQPGLAQSLVATDPEDGAANASTYSNAITFRILSIGTNTMLYYNGVKVVVGQPSADLDFDPSKLVIYGATSSAGPFSFTFSLLDAAKQVGTAATYSVSSANILPITLTNFSGVKTPAGNVLSWTANNAVNFAHFELQRSTSGSSFSTIATVAVNASGSYSYTDAGAKGTNYYRLAMVDLDGSTTYSNTVAIVGNGSSFAVASIYPNPTASLLNIALYTPTATNVTYTITDISGRVMGKQVHAASAATTQQISVSNLARGTYLITVDANGTKTTSKFTKL